MRARRRRSVMNTIAAAVLEVAIMGIFVIIAQPQLRDALFEILHVSEPAVARPSGNPSGTNPSRGNSRPTGLASVPSLDHAVQTLRNSPVGQAIENSLTSNASNQANAMAPANSLHGAGYSPFDQYESFRVELPSTNSSPATQSSANQFTGSQYPAPQYAPSQYGTQMNNSYNAQPIAQPGAAYGTQNGAQYGNQYSAQYGAQHGNQYNSLYSNQSIAPYAAQYAAQPVAQQTYVAHNPAATQLMPNQWNIASAAQSPYYVPNATSNSQWIPQHATETSYRQVAPPPYGTQSMWK